MTDVYLDVSYRQLSALARIQKPQSQTQSSELLLSLQCFPPPYLPGRSTHAVYTAYSWGSVSLCLLSWTAIYTLPQRRLAWKAGHLAWCWNQSGALQVRRMISVQILIFRHLFKVKAGYKVSTDSIIITLDIYTVYNTLSIYIYI